MEVIFSSSGDFILTSVLVVLAFHSIIHLWQFLCSFFFPTNLQLLEIEGNALLNFFFFAVANLDSFISVQSFSRVQLFCTPWTRARQVSLSITNSQSLLKLIFIKSVMPSKHLILCHPLLFLPLIFPSIRVFSNESALHNRWPKYWSFSFSISPSNEYPRLHFFFFFERPVIFYLLKMNSFGSKGNFSKKHQKVQCKASPH